MDNYFVELNNINLNNVKEKKNNLDYISWAWAWQTLKEHHPDATYTIYENPALGGLPYFTDGRTCMVKVGVTVEGIEHIEWLPVMDYRNASIPLERVTSMDVNKTVQRAMVKAIARHGIGLYVYAGEDLPCEPKPVDGPILNDDLVNIAMDGEDPTPWLELEAQTRRPKPAKPAVEPMPEDINPFKDFAPLAEYEPIAGKDQLKRVIGATRAKEVLASLGMTSMQLIKAMPEETYRKALTIAHDMWLQAHSEVGA